MVYVGIDLHRKFSQLAVLAEDGDELLSRKVVNQPEVLKAILAKFGGQAKVMLEASFGWEWLAELLEAEGMSCTWRIRCGRGRSRRHA
jgi:hypothetical protein